MTMRELHPLVKQLLDGELTLDALPPELVAEGRDALRLVSAADRTPVTLSAQVEARVMAAVRRRAARPRAGWRWLTEPREIRMRVRPWTLAPALAAAAALILLVGRPSAPTTPTVPSAATTVRLMLFAPQAHQVAVAGTFNQWDPAATPLARTGAPGVWAATLNLPAGQHQYVFVVDGQRWVPDPAAPTVDDGFGRRNSVLSL